LLWLRKRQRVLLGIAVFAVSLVYLWWIAGTLFNLGVDEGIYLEGGRRLAAGQVVYRDFFVLTGPLTFWIEGLLARVGGTDIPLLRLPLLVDVSFLAWAVYWLAAQFESEWFAAGLSLAFLAFASKVHSLVVKHRWDSAALATAAVLCAVAAQRSGSRKLWLLSGALVAAGAWATPSVGWVAVPLVIWAGRRYFVLPLAGGALVSAAAVGYLAATHALVPMIAAMRWTAANYGQANSVPYGSLSFSSDAGSTGWAHGLVVMFEWLPALLPIAALAGWTWRLWRRREPKEMPAVAPLLGVTVALVVTAWPRWSSLQLLFVAAIPFAMCGILLHRTLGDRWRPAVYAALGLLAAVSMVQKTAQAYDYSPVSTRAGQLYGSPEDVEFMEPFERRIPRGDSLFVFPYLPALYPLLDGHNPTRYLYLQPGMMTAADEREALAEVEAGQPHWVVLADVSRQAILATWPGSDPARIPMEAMHLYLRTHYRAVDRVTGKWGIMTILQRQ